MATIEFRGCSPNWHQELFTRRQLTEEILLPWKRAVSTSRPCPSSRFLSQLLPVSLRNEPVMRRAKLPTRPLSPATKKIGFNFRPGTQEAANILLEMASAVRHLAGTHTDQRINRKTTTTTTNTNIKNKQKVRKQTTTSPICRTFFQCYGVPRKIIFI